MKVVLFCGGRGMRMRGAGSEDLPKPMVPLGSRPILWHLMKYYAHWGHRDFILCLGYKGEAIKDYFANYKEWVSNDFVLSGGRKVELLNRDMEDWRITFVDTGLDSCIGERLWAVRRFLRDEEMFLANYADGLSDCPVALVTEALARGGGVAAMMTAAPNCSFHMVQADETGRVSSIRDVDRAAMRVNAGFFAFRQEIFQYMRPGEELVEQPFARLIEARRLIAVPYDGFWRCCDTFKDLQTLETLLCRRQAPWQVWQRDSLFDDPPPAANDGARPVVAAE